MTNFNQPYPGETNGLVDPSAYHANVTAKIAEYVDWTDSRLARITRLRLLSDPGFPMWDVSYCHGELRDGTPCDVELPFSQLPKGKGRMVGAIIAAAKADKVYAKGLGIFNVISTLI